MVEPRRVAETDAAKAAYAMKLMKQVKDHRQRNKLLYYNPYDKQLEFHKLGAECRERLFMAGNQLGKTYSGAMEFAFHVTGRYPDWWPGRRWNRPIKAWVAGETGIAVRDTSQRLLMGEPGVKELFGTGTIPADTILDTSLARGVTDALDTVHVRHVSGGVSAFTFKSYEQGRAKWQGPTLDLVWYDEEPPQDIYSEGLTRVTATGGMVYMTFTPLLGMSDVVRRYLDTPTEDRKYVRMGIKDAGHISEEEREKIIAGYPEHEREARANGEPLLGSGRIFPFPDSAISYEPMDLPEHWALLGAVDFGIEHPFAYVSVAWDRDTDTIYVFDAYRVSGVSSADHVAAIRMRGPLLPIVWPQDGTQREKGSGQAVSNIYRKQGLNLLPKHVTFPDGTNSVEAGVMEMGERFRSGRLKIARHLSEVFEEIRMYHRKDGLIVKERDDLISAIRYAVMGIRFARTVDQLGARRRRASEGPTQEENFYEHRL